MTLSGSRGIVRVSKNLPCELQAAMAAENVKEPEFYQRVTGQKFPGEYGERASARRRGSKFEAILAQNNAARLRAAVAERFGYPDAEALVVRNFGEETGGGHRLIRVRRIFAELAAGKAVPHILIQAHLRLPVGPELADFGTIYPDVLILDPDRQMYLPAEAKSFIARGNVVDPPDLDIARRQAAVQIVALRAEADRVGLADRVFNRAAFIFAQPYGLTPALPVVEDLDAEVREVTLALERIREVRLRLRELRGATPGAPLDALLDDFDRNYQDRCVGSCILASQCEQQFVGQARVLGDAAASVLGPATPLERVRALALGARPQTPEEVALAQRLVEAARDLGMDLPAASA